MAADDSPETRGCFQAFANIEMGLLKTVTRRTGHLRYRGPSVASAERYRGAKPVRNSKRENRCS